MAHFAKLAFLCCGLLLVSERANAVSCEAIFSNGAQTHKPSSTITLRYHSVIMDGGTELRTPSLTDHSNWNSCGTAACSAQPPLVSPPVVPIAASDGTDGDINVPFRSNDSYPSGSYGSVTVNQEARLRLRTNNGTYHTRGVTAGYRSMISFSPGDYWIDGDLTLANEVELRRSGSGPIRIFVNGSVSLNFRTRTVGIDAEDLFIYAKNDITLANESEVSGFLHSETGSISLAYKAKVWGAVSGATGVSLANEAEIRYDGAAAASSAFTPFCGTAGSPLSAWQIEVGASPASTCAPRSVTVSARDSTGQVLSEYTGTLSLSTSTGSGDWSTTGIAGDADGALAPGSLDSGAADYTFDATGQDQGQVTLQLANSHAHTLTVTASDASLGVSSVSASLTFADNAFVVSNTDILADDVVAGRAHGMRVQMVQKDVVSGECGPAEHYNVGSVKVWLDRDAADPGGTAPTITNTANAAAPLPSTEPGAANVTLPFVAGTADFHLSAHDVGKYALNFRDSSLSFADVDITGGSEPIVARPFGFAITVPDNPAATSATGSAFRTAGENFSVTVTAVAWQAGDDSDDNGAPDGHDDGDPSNNADLGNNPVLIRFGQEMPGAAVALAANLVLPAGGADPGLSDGEPGASDGRSLGTFINGSATTQSVYFSDVGIIDISASIADGNYLGQSAVATLRSSSRSGHIGRFTPAFFTITPDQVKAACTVALDYSYMDQPFAVDFALTARSQHASITANYGGDFAKIGPAGLAFHAMDQALPTSLSDRITASGISLDWLSGIATVSAEVTLQRATLPDGPFEQANIGVVATDADAATVLPSALDLDSDSDGTNNAVNLGQTEIRFGRLRLSDSFGPETADLPVAFYTEHWLDDRWQINVDDSCTAIALADIAYEGRSIDTAANRSVAMGAGDTTGEYAQLNATEIRMSGGDAGHHFTAPGAGNTGFLEVDIDVIPYPWLRFDWNGDGSFADPSLPTATFTFGTYRGHDRVLYWREVLH